ncbi:hypothetical protein Goshw_009084, partial [Gossypium schwendimanii]|nr:hypothetical protein [Gossypium schwendimanii]
VPVRFAEEDEYVIEDYSWCLVGRVFTESVVQFPSLRNTMMERGEDPLQIPLNHAIFWVQVHNL